MQDAASHRPGDIKRYRVDPNRPNAGDIITTNGTNWIYDPSAGWCDSGFPPDQLQGAVSALRAIADAPHSDAIKARIQNHYSDRRILEECRNHARDFHNKIVPTLDGSEAA